MKLLNMIFPRFCVLCEKEGGVWCRSCDESYWPAHIVSTCPFCHMGESNRVCDSCSSETYLDGLSAFGLYGNPMFRSALTQWKYHGDQDIQVVIEKWLRRGSALLRPPFDSFQLTYLPLHASRYRARGFDQAEELAKILGGMWEKEVVNLLHRTKNTKPQAQVGHENRIVGDIDEIFEVIELVDKNVLICDDVFTSGATMDAAAKCLKEAGAKEVWGMVVAKGG